MKLRDNPDAVLSPYLRDHIANPVDWWQWGSDAFDEARSRDVPIMVSVGYAACHWCHVMAHESFEDPVLAAYLNEHFVSIKVDREERPDVDAVYMQVTQELTGHGGWPMTVFLDHAGRAFYAGTYYPRVQRGGMPSLRQVLESVSDAWHTRRSDIETSARAIAEGLGRRQELPDSATEFTETVVSRAVMVLAEQFDAENGGFGRAPKFPPSNVLQFLARHVARTGSQPALAMLTQTCEAMARSGMYDQLGGGFARYSVDAAWVVPHFEKMLYDNALLVSAYTAWWRLGGGTVAERIVTETIGFMLREMLTPQLAFASALDADSDGREGAFYVWTPDEFNDVLGADATWAQQIFEVTATGTFEDGASTLQLRPELIDDPERFESIRLRLSAARSARVRPATDDKVVTSWNGLAIAAVAEAGATFDRPEWVEAARECATFVWGAHVTRRDDNTVRLARLSRAGVVSSADGVLVDYGDLAQGLLTLYSVTGDETWFVRSVELLAAVREHFLAPDGGFFDTADDAETLVQRPREYSDGAHPAGASAVVGALVTIAGLSGDTWARDQVEASLTRAVPLFETAPRFAGWLLAAGEAFLAGPCEVAIIDPKLGAGELARTFWATPTAGAVLGLGTPDGSAQVPLVAGKGLVAGAAAAYVCHDFVCRLPVTTGGDLAASLSEND